MKSANVGAKRIHIVLYLLCRSLHHYHTPSSSLYYQSLIPVGPAAGNSAKMWQLPRCTHWGQTSRSHPTALGGLWHPTRDNPCCTKTPLRRSHCLSTYKAHLSLRTKKDLLMFIVQIDTMKCYPAPQQVPLSGQKPWSSSVCQFPTKHLHQVIHQVPLATGHGRPQRTDRRQPTPPTWTRRWTS